MPARVITLKELAASLDLSITTVSRALAGHQQIAQNRVGQDIAGGNTLLEQRNGVLVALGAGISTSQPHPVADRRRVH